MPQTGKSINQSKTHTTMATEIDFEALREELPYKWRVQSFSTFKAEATCVAYVDSRDVQKRLDDVVRPGNWQDEYYEVKNNLFCRIGIRVNGEWTWKGDCGTESNVDKEKGEASDAFKRAAVKWGIGRFLYDLGMQKLKASEIKGAGKSTPFPIDDHGNRIWDITKHINALNKAKATVGNKSTPDPAKVATAKAAMKVMPTAKPKVATPEQIAKIKDLLDHEVIDTETLEKGLKRIESGLTEEAGEVAIKYYEGMIAKRTTEAA